MNIDPESLRDALTDKCERMQMLLAECKEIIILNTPSHELRTRYGSLFLAINHELLGHKK